MKVGVIVVGSGQAGVQLQAGASGRAIVEAEFVHPTFAGAQSLVMTLERFSLS